jgi:Zn-dependent protease with chaperone function
MKKICALFLEFFVLLHQNALHATSGSSVEDFVSDAHIQQLLPRDIKDIPDDQKTLVQEFLTLRSSSEMQNIYDFVINLPENVTARDFLKEEQFSKQRELLVSWLKCSFDEERIKYSEQQLYFYLGFLAALAPVAGLVALPKSKAPLLHDKVEQLAARLHVAKPIIFVCFDDSVALQTCEALAFSQDGFLCRANVVVGAQVLMGMDDTSLEVLLVHELGHIKLEHTRLLKAFHPRRDVLCALSGLMSAALVMGVGIKQWKYRILTFLGTGCLFTYLLRKFCSERGVWGYFNRACEIEADRIAIDLYGSEAFIKAMQQLAYIYTLEDDALSKDEITEALGDSLSPDEDQDTLWQSIKSANNEDHPSLYERIVYAARIGAKKLTPVPTHAG